MKRALILLLIIILCTSIGIGIGMFIPRTGNDSSMIEGPGYDTAEEAATAYINALKTGDPAAVISTFAIESYVDNFDLAAYIRYINIYFDTHDSIRLPDSNAYAAELNYMSRYTFISKQVYNGYRTLIGYPFEREHIAFSPRDKDYDQQIDTLIASLSDENFMDKITSLEFVELLTPSEMAAVMSEDESVFCDNLETAVSPIYSYLDCEDIRCFAAKCIYDGREVYIFIDVVKIDGRWYNLSPNSVLGMQCDADTISGGIAFIE